MRQPVHFALEVRDQAATLLLNRNRQSGDAFDLAMLAELEMVVHEASQQTQLKTLLLRGSWDFDFDYDSLLGTNSSVSYRNFLIRSQQLLQRLEHFGEQVRTIAMLEGDCSGVGLEIALACSQRIGRQQPGNRLRFDYAQRGTLPVLGGVQRLCRLATASKTRKLLSHSLAISLVEAEHLGLMTQLFPYDATDTQIDFWLDQSHEKPRNSRLLNFWKRLGSNTPLRRARFHSIPATEGSLQVMHGVLAAGRSCVSEGLAAERNAALELTETPAFKHSLRLEPLCAPSPGLHLNPPSEIGIVAGTSRAVELAIFLAERGTEVILHPGDESGVTPLTSLREQLSLRLKRGFCSEHGAEAMIEKIRISSQWSDFAELGCLLEASGKEEFDRTELYLHLGELLPRTCVVISIDAEVAINELQAGFPAPERVIGLRVIESVESRTLVELFPGISTDEEVTDLATGWLRSWGLIPTSIPSGSESVTHRLLAIYLCEAVHLVSEGMPPERIDREFRRLGMRRGPLETLDLIGFDTVARWVEQLTPSLEVSNLRLERMRSLGWNGASNGEGFYRYRRGKKWENEIARMVLWRSQEDDCLTHYVTDADEAMRTGIDRVLLRTANEAIRMLEESISPETIDLLTARGLKLLPHQGGILTYAEERGLHELQDRLLEFCDRFGKRFEPCEELQRRVELGEGLQLITGEIPARRLRRAG